ncbi:DUF3618 domain-containing protein [Streptomyces sp. HUAS TT20]|uniref:DUF3618 domain-containing protein n=1 Tax=Streptomyces sp. HUAS TT20 TaxID=3447509 RepID=UPI0021DA0461|nr:DUF3618 domain-containing protein [Streptomyces sp. HUAS 15-9]UXY26830.1 DUF3618 domain-containing protein [Streptomyces sp. HUAS 15-9]
MTDRTPQGAGAKGPEELRQQMEQSGSRLGDTAEELAGKGDLKGRARARAADLRDKAGAMTVQLRSSATQAGHAVQDRAAHAGHTVEQSAPPPVRAAVGFGRRHPRSALLVGAAAGMAAVAASALRHRSHARDSYHGHHGRR